MTTSSNPMGRQRICTSGAQGNKHGPWGPAAVLCLARHTFETPRGILQAGLRATRTKNFPFCPTHPQEAGWASKQNTAQHGEFETPVAARCKSSCGQGLLDLECPGIRWRTGCDVGCQVAAAKCASDWPEGYRGPRRVVDPQPQPVDPVHARPNPQHVN